jgi:hypothetical protein
VLATSAARPYTDTASGTIIEELFGVQSDEGVLLRSEAMGILKDREQAVSWLKRAAEQGVAEAVDALDDLGMAEHGGQKQRKEQAQEEEEEVEEEQEQEEEQEEQEEQEEEHAREIADLCGHVDGLSFLKGHRHHGMAASTAFTATILEGLLLMSVAYKGTTDNEKRVAHNEAAERFNEASQMSPRCAELHAKMGSQLLEGIGPLGTRGQYSNALGPLELAADLDPLSHATLFALSRTQLHLGKYVSAAENARLAVANAAKSRKAGEHIQESVLSAYRDHAEETALIQAAKKAQRKATKKAKKKSRKEAETKAKIQAAAASAAAAAAAAPPAAKIQAAAEKKAEIQTAAKEVPKGMRKVVNSKKTFSTINEGSMLDGWPTQAIKRAAGKAAWGGWKLADGMIGEVVHSWGGSKHLLKVDDKYIVVGEDALEQYKVSTLLCLAPTIPAAYPPPPPSPHTSCSRGRIRAITSTTRWACTS